MAYKNIEDKRDYDRRYAKSHPKEMKKYQDNYYLNHREEKLKRSKEYYYKHKKRIDVRHGINRKSVEGIYTQIKGSNKQNRKIKFDMTKEEFITWYKKQERKCVYCDRTEKEVVKDRNGRFTRLSIDRKDNNKGYEIDNIVLCCLSCNATKSDFFTYDEMLKIGKIIKDRK